MKKKLKYVPLEEEETMFNILAHLHEIRWKVLAIRKKPAYWNSVLEDLVYLLAESMEKVASSYCDFNYRGTEEYRDKRRRYEAEKIKSITEFLGELNDKAEGKK